MIRKIEKGFQFIDLYKRPIGMLYRGQQASTMCGGFITIFIVMLSVLMFFNPTLNFAKFDSYSWIVRSDFQLINPLKFKTN